MRSPLLIGLAWVATVALAFLLGGQMRSETPTRDDGRPAADRLPQVAPEAPPLPRPPDPRDPDAVHPAESRTAAPARTEGDVAPVVVEAGMNAEDLSAALMRYVAAKLAQGPEGHKELFREFDKLLRNKELKQMFRDESQVMPHVYPWVKFLVDHDRQVIAMMETLYRTAADDPQWFQGLDEDSFEAFAEGLALLLPGATNEEQLARFRGYAERIVEMDPQSLPGALQKNLRDIQRDLEWWAPPLTADQMVAALGDPGQPLTTKIAILRRASADSLRGIDVTPIVADAFRQGNRYAINVVQRFRDAIALPTVDAAFLDGVAGGRVPWHYVSSYAGATGRTTWEAVRPFLDTGLARGGAATEAFARSLIYFQHVAPKEYVAAVVASYALPEDVRNQLKKQYGIE